MKDPVQWAAAAQRSDLVQLGKALRAGDIPREQLPALFAALQDRAKVMNERFRARLNQLVAEFAGNVA
jgi:hypothetical protein